MKRLAYFLMFLLIPAIAYAYTVGTPNNMVPPNWVSYAVDPGAYDSGVTSTSKVTLKNLIDDLGTTRKATIVFPHTGSGTTTQYTISTALDLSSYSNITFQIENGAQLYVSPGVSGVTLPSPANVKAQSNQQIVSGTSLYFNAPGTVYGEWFGAARNLTTDDGAAFRSAAASISLVGGVIELQGKYLIDSADSNAGIVMTDGMSIKGHNRSICELRAGASFPAKPLIYAKGTTTKIVHLEGFTVRAGTGSGVIDGFLGDTIASSSIRNIGAYSFANGSAIRIEASGASTAYFNIIENPYISASKYGITLYGASNGPNCTTITGGEIVGTAASVSGVSIAGIVAGTYVIGTDIENVFSSAAIYSNSIYKNYFMARTEMTGGSKTYNFPNSSNNLVMLNSATADTFRPLDIASGSSMPQYIQTQEVRQLSHTQASGVTIPYTQAMHLTYDISNIDMDSVIYLLPVSSFPAGFRVSFNRRTYGGDDSDHVVIIKTYSGDYFAVPSESSKRYYSLLYDNCVTFVGDGIGRWIVEKSPDVYSTSAPSLGIWERGKRVWDLTPESGVSPGWINVLRLSTTTTVEASATTTWLHLASIASMAVNDKIAVELTGVSPFHWSYIDDISGSGTTVSIHDAIPAGSAASVGNGVYTARWKEMMKLGD